MEENLCVGTVFAGTCFRVKDPMSALTHFIGFWMALMGMPILLIRASVYGESEGKLISLAIFMLSMILLYGASTAYHTFHISDRADQILKKMDHMMIFVLIAGSYTPVCTIVLRENGGWSLLALIWGIAAAGIAFKALWVNCPKWVSSVIYIGMGWAALLSLSDLWRMLPSVAFGWLLLGGILYTIGGVIYALKLTRLFRNPDWFGAHELFHVFVMLGSLCHYIMMLECVAKM